MSISTLKEIENTWKEETQKGNQFCKTASFAKAIDHYMKAMITSELLLANTAFAWQQAVPVPKLYYTACINLANTYRKAGDNRTAADYFLYCTFKIKQMCDCSTFDNNIYKLQLCIGEKRYLSFPPFQRKKDYRCQLILQKMKPIIKLKN